MSRRGTTLVELLVVMAIWSAVMTAVLGFYIYGTRVSQRYDALSQQLREVQALQERLCGPLTQALIREVVVGDRPAFRFVRCKEPSFLPDWTSQDEILAIVDGKLLHQREGQVSTLMVLPSSMLVRLVKEGNAYTMEVRVPVKRSRKEPLDLSQDSNWRLIRRSLLLTGLP